MTTTDGVPGAGRRHRSSKGAGRRRRRPAGSRWGRWCSTPRSCGYQEIVTDPSYAGQIITFTYPHIGNYGVNADDDESRRAALPGGDRPRAHRAGRAAGGPPTACVDYLDRHRGARPRRASTPAASPATCATTGAMPGAFGVDEAATRCSQAAQADGGTDGHRPRRRRDRRRAVHASGRRRDAPFRGRRLRLRDQAHHPRHLVAAGCQVEVVPGRHAGRRRARPRARRRVPLERPGRPGGGHRRGRPASARCSARCRCSASASATRSSALALGGRTYKLRFGHHGAQPPGPPRGERPGRDHQPEPQLRGRGRRAARGCAVTHVNLNDGVVRGPRGARAAAPSRVQYHPEAGPGPPRPGVPLRRVHRPAWPGPADRAAPRRPHTILLHRQRADRDRPGLRVRLLGHPGLPGPAPTRATGSCS